jgi:hypothetical protein
MPTETLPTKTLIGNFNKNPGINVDSVYTIGKIVDSVNINDFSRDQFMLSTAGVDRSTPLNRSWSALSPTSQALVIYGVLMLLALGFTYIVSLGDSQTLRGVGIWAKPMKFMAATALFALTTVWLVSLVGQRIDQKASFKWIAGLIVLTSLFEVVYITYQAVQGEASHYNTSDPIRAIMFGLMAIAAVGLTASQAWLAWVIWQSRTDDRVSVVTLSVLIALVLTFALSTFSGFLLGASQPPAGAGMPITGWHWHQDLRPSHFLAVHAQQLIPVLGMVAVYAFGRFARAGLIVGSAFYLTAWLYLTWVGLGLEG